jgi:hypothetical protein
MASAFLAALAACATLRWSLVACGIAVLTFLWPVTRYIQQSDSELAAAHVALFGLIVGVHWRTSGDEPFSAGAPSRPFAAWKDDAVAFAVGTTVGVIVCRVVLHAWTVSGDEWAYTFQAALFAKLHAYGSVPPCPGAFRSFWVFQWMGRSFAQYTPGWPYFMTPFVAVGAAWLAGPTSLGLLAASACRLGRRAAAGCSLNGSQPSSGELRAAGHFASVAIVFGAITAINGASRYSHVFEAAVFAWAVEALLTVATPGLSARAQLGWGGVLGVSALLMLAVRPADGATLGIGLLAYAAYALACRRIALRSLVSGATAFAVLGGLTLVVLRLQLGRWFVTGYSLTPDIYPYLVVGFSPPQASEYRYGIPLAVGAYCWWPCSPAVGIAGIVALRGRGARLALVFVASTLAFLTFYVLSAYGRGYGFGYGPRFHVPLVVPMGVGTGVVLARLWASALQPSGNVAAIRAGGPAAVALVAVVLGVARIALLVYPIAYADAHLHNLLHEGLATANLHNAVVFGGYGLNRTNPMDLTENLPLDLYPHQDVLIAIDSGSEAVRCVREQYPNRAFYRAVPGDPVRFVPF